MGSMNFKGLVKEGSKYAQKHAPEILTGVGIAGMFVAGIVAIKGTTKAMKIIEAEKRERTSVYFEDVDNNWEECELSKIDYVKLCWKPYLPAAILFVGASGCLIGAASVNLRRNVALAAAYKIAETSYREYKDKVVEVVGEKKHKVIREKLAQDKVNKFENEDNGNKQIIITGRGSTKCIEGLTGHKFYSDYETLRSIENTLNERLFNDNYVSLNEFYIEVGIDPVDKLGNDLGWNVEYGKIKFSYDSILDKNNEPCLLVDFNITPRYDYNRAIY